MTAAAVTAYVGIGSNLGDPPAQVADAIRRLGRLPRTRLVAQSSLFRSSPVDAGGADFVNAVARLETRLSAHELLREMQSLETAAGRERPFRNAPRTLDLDLLLYGDQEISTPSLTVPHPRLTQRAFVLMPLLQIDPAIAVPGLGPAHRFVPAVAGQTIRKIE